MSVEEPTIDSALKHHALPRLYPETSTAIASFMDQGYSLLTLPSRSPDHLALLSQLPGLSLAPASASFSWVSLCSQTHLTLRWSQILVVTSDIYRTAQPARATGFPTAFIKRVGSRSAKLSTPTAPPTYILTALSELLPALKDPASVPKPQDPAVITYIRRCGFTAATKLHSCWGLGHSVRPSLPFPSHVL